jgi:hypothetical protein
LDLKLILHARDGSKILFSTSTYSFKDHKSTPEVRVLDAASKESNLVTDDKNASEPTWLDDHLILLLVGGENGKTDIVIGSYDAFSKTWVGFSTPLIDTSN